MRMKPRLVTALVALVAVIAVTSLAGCGGTASPSSSTLDPSKDKLAQVLARGTLVLFTDPDYAPQSFLVKGAARAAGTKCTANQLTGAEISGYDAETGKLVAAELGVEPCFVTPPFNEVIGGGWADRWDVAWGSGALTADRMTRLYVTQPYYSTPANFFVGKDSPVQSAAELAGKKIGACAGCTHELYLKGQLTLPGEKLVVAVANPQIVTYASEKPGLEALAKGDLDAFLCSEPVGAAKIKDGGLALRELATPAFTTQKTGYVDRSLTLNPVAFLDRINAALRSLHASGKLKALSVQFFGVDYATTAAAFDLGSIGQKVP
jgi:polar amino acid transport system substrate-binding protein